MIGKVAWVWLPLAAVTMLIQPAFGIEPFSMTCEDVTTHGYRNHTDVGQEWTTDEQFSGGPWQVRYDGGDTIRIDGDDLSIISSTSKSLVAVAPATNAFAATAWSYAINLQMGEMVASQVHSFAASNERASVMGRTVQFECHSE